jgi:hypothetical protein
MKSAEQRQWEAEQYERLEPCPDCELPMVDRGDRRHWPAACTCPSCEWCGAHGTAVGTSIIDDDEVCRACRDAETR